MRVTFHIGRWVRRILVDMARVDENADESMPSRWWFLTVRSVTQTQLLHAAYHHTPDGLASFYLEGWVFRVDVRPWFGGARTFYRTEARVTFRQGQDPTLLGSKPTPVQLFEHLGTFTDPDRATDRFFEYTEELWSWLVAMILRQETAVISRQLTGNARSSHSGSGKETDHVREG